MSYCIFNKQYTKDERHEKVDKIFSQMQSDGTLGSYLPATMNPFYYNDTAAYLIDDSFTKEEVEAAGYLRRNEEIKVDIPDRMDVVDFKDLGQYEGWTVDGIFTTVALTKPPAQGHPPLEGGQFNGSPLLKGEEKGVSGHTNRSRTIDPSILKKVIRDESGNSYRIIKMEYDFLVKHGLPLPRKHRLERLKSHFAISPD